MQTQIEKNHKNIIETSVAIIGGGLAGIMVANRLSKERVPIVIIDQSPSNGDSLLGGFARFSGAKFSPLPAGMGLFDLVGDEIKYFGFVQELSDILGLNHKDNLLMLSKKNVTDISLAKGVRFRKYDPKVFTLQEMNNILNKITQFPNSVIHLNGNCTELVFNGTCWDTFVSNSNGEMDYIIRSHTIFFAGGRIGSTLLKKIGLKPTAYKGIDLGVRIEVPNRSTFSLIQELSQDAKLLYKNCRTFCLNCPGKMYRYAFNDIMIAGGIVADESCPTANIGLLYRTDDKEKNISNIIDAINTLGHKKIYKPHSICGSSFQDVINILKILYGGEVASELNEFKIILEDLNLIDWSSSHIVHIPLLDWYWPVFGTKNGFQTEFPQLFVVGDAAGHARGLFQAALSGWLGAEEYLRCTSH